MNEFSLKTYQIQCDYTAEASRKYFKIHNFLSQLAHFLHIYSNCCTARENDNPKIKIKTHEKSHKQLQNEMKRKKMVPENEWNSETFKVFSSIWPSKQKSFDVERIAETDRQKKTQESRKKVMIFVFTCIMYERLMSWNVYKNVDSAPSQFISFTSDWNCIHTHNRKNLVVVHNFWHLLLFPFHSNGISIFVLCSHVNRSGTYTRAKYQKSLPTIHSVCTNIEIASFWIECSTTHTDGTKSEQYIAAITTKKRQAKERNDKQTRKKNTTNFQHTACVRLQMKLEWSVFVVFFFIGFLSTTRVTTHPSHERPEDQTIYCRRLRRGKKSTLSTTID